MRRTVAVVLGVYLLIAAGNRVAEHLGAMRCHCSQDCWCRRRPLSLFRWVFPWSHRSASGSDPTGERDAEAG